MQNLSYLVQKPQVNFYNIGVWLKDRIELVSQEKIELSKSDASYDSTFSNDKFQFTLIFSPKRLFDLKTEGWQRCSYLINFNPQSSQRFEIVVYSYLRHLIPVKYKGGCLTEIALYYYSWSRFTQYFPFIFLCKSFLLIHYTFFPDL